MSVHYKQLRDNFKYLTKFDEKNIGHFKVFVNKTSDSRYQYHIKLGYVDYLFHIGLFFSQFKLVS